DVVKSATAFNLAQEAAATRAVRDAWLLLGALGALIGLFALGIGVLMSRSIVRPVGEVAMSLAAASEELTALSHQMSSTAEETSNQASLVSAASDQVSRSVRTVSASVVEMGATIQEIAKNTSDGARIAALAAQEAESTNHSVTRLGASSAEIGNVIK